MGQVGLDVDLPFGPQLLQHSVNDNVGSSSTHTRTAVHKQRSIWFLAGGRGFLDEAQDWSYVVGRSAMVRPAGKLELHNVTCTARVTWLVSPSLPVVAYPQSPHRVVGLKQISYSYYIIDQVHNPISSYIVWLFKTLYSRDITNYILDCFYLNTLLYHCHINDTKAFCSNLWPILFTFSLALLHDICDHHNDTHPLVPNTSPEFCDCGWQWSLDNDNIVSMTQ